MDIEIRGGERPFWVSEFGCFLANRECAFYYEPEHYPRPPLPLWFGHPNDSARRDSRDFYSPARPLEEHRSMTASAAEVVAFYEERLTSGGLIIDKDIVVDDAVKATSLSRFEPGLYAESAEYYFALEAYEHKGIAFWKILHGTKLPPSFQPKLRYPKHLLWLGEEEGRVTLRNPESGEDCWTAREYLSEQEPRYVKRSEARTPRQEHSILWSRLPGWLQFGLPDEAKGSASESALGGWTAAISAQKCEGPIQGVFEICLDSLDAHDFDPSGEEKPDRSYYVVPSTGGRHLHAFFKTEAGESGGVVVVNVYADPSIYVHYHTPGSLMP